ncbi:MAG: type I-A CRISPR-associated protein Cas5 [Thermoprotei archaeon]|nr:MAG: type I-A CRISPR-associated protein Cas5 [Thermoprotei archaeon]
MYLLKVDISFHWGFSVKKPFYSATQPCYRVPPPTSLLGALARGVQYLKRGSEVIVEQSAYYSSVKLLLETVPYTFFSFRDVNVEPTLGLPVTMDITRVLLAPYLRAEHAAKPEYRFGIQPHGKVYAPCLKATLGYLIKEIEEDYVDLNVLEKAAWCISSLGTKESLVAVHRVQLLKLKKLDRREVSTKFWFEKDLVENTLLGSYLIESLPLPSLEGYKIGIRDVFKQHKVFIVPLIEVKVSVNERALCLSDGEEVYVVPKEVVL